jgi:catechol 2,3-dioxygenase-like lactoylglutathione lyase family enzyme
MPQTTITDIGTVGIPVSDQDKAVDFFVGTLGFDKRLDVPIGPSRRWVTVAAPGASTTVALIANPQTGADTGIRFMVPDAQTEHSAMRQRGIEVGDLLRWPGVPPMFEFKDPDGNRFEIVQEPRGGTAALRWARRLRPARHASRVIIRQAPMTDQPTIQPTMTEIIAQVGIGGMPRAPRPPNSARPGPPGPEPVPGASPAGRSWSIARPTTSR